MSTLSDPQFARIDRRIDNPHFPRAPLDLSGFVPLFSPLSIPLVKGTSSPSPFSRSDLALRPSLPFHATTNHARTKLLGAPNLSPAAAGQGGHDSGVVLELHLPPPARRDRPRRPRGEATSSVRRVAAEARSPKEPCTESSATMQRVVWMEHDGTYIEVRGL